MPTSTKESWTLAETYIYRELLEATGHKDAQNAFLGFLPDGLPNVFSFKMDGETADLAMIRNGKTCTLIFGARVEGFFTERAMAQQFSMAIMDILPIRNESNVQWFRPSAGSGPRLLRDGLELKGGQVAPGFRLSWDFEVIFNTSKVY
jgi:hypothetical protein